MRISNGQQWDGYAGRIRETQARMIAAQTQITDGKRLHKPSDDPNALSDALDVRSYRSAIETYKANLTRGQGLLKDSEATLDETATLMRRAATLAIAGANTPTDQQARRAMASEVGDLRDRLVGLANEKAADGTALFAGQRTDATPFAVTTAGLVYSGDANPLGVESDSGETIPVSVDGAKVFTEAYERLTKLKDALEGGDVANLSDARLGELQTSGRDLDLLRGVIGVRRQTLDAREATHARRIEELTARGSDLEDADLSQAITDYKSAETAYSAALQVTSMASKLSLMDFLR